MDIVRGWVRVLGKGDKERRVPVDRDVAALIQAYLLTERPKTDNPALFIVTKGPTRGRPDPLPSQAELLAGARHRASSRGRATVSAPAPMLP